MNHAERLMGRPELAWPAVAVLASVVAGAAVSRSTTLSLAVVLVAAAALAWLLLGPETILVLALLTACGLIPFVDPELPLLGGTVPLWTLAFAIAAAVAVIAWAARQATGDTATHFEPSLLIALVFTLLAYTTIRLGASDPLAIPSTTARFAALAPAALLGYLVFSQPKAVDGLRRALPLLIGLLVVWAVAYVGAASGQCAGCLEVVQSGSEREGLSGTESRIYTSGQESFNGFALLALGTALATASPLMIGLALLAFVNVALQASRAQYLAIAVGALVLIGWRFMRSRPGARVALVFAVGIAAAAIVTSAVGERAVSGYQELSTATGNAGYRLRLLDEAQRAWSLFGDGVGVRSSPVGLNFDLGLPNTLLALGYVGAALQLAVLVAAIVRGIQIGGAVGFTLAAVFVYVLVARPSLPLLEYGPSSLAYGLAIGATCALVPRPSRARGAAA